jgi:multidrug efflux system outer membrane protein
LQQWWTRFGDARLDQLITQAIEHNPNVKAAVASIKASRHQRNVTRFDLAPIVTQGSSYTNTRLAGANLPPVFPRDQELWDAGIDATWELDLFGRVRRNIEAASADLATTEAVRDDLLVSVTAETGLTYFELRGLLGQLEVARRNAGNQRSTLELTKKLMDGGRGTELDVSRAQSQLSNTLASIPPLEAAIARSYHRLAVLTGRTPDALRGSLGKNGLPGKLPSVKFGKPDDLLRRRPDIRAAERQLAAATARVGVATADLFPRVTFGGGIGFSAATLDGLGRSGSDNFAFGPNVNWAFLDSPRRHQLVKAAGARVEGRLETYRQTVLLALEDTENALTNYGQEQARRAHLGDAVTASANAAKLARQRFEGGTASFLEVLDAERVHLTNEAALAESRKATATHLIRLFKALGGGWNT